MKIILLLILSNIAFASNKLHKTTEPLIKKESGTYMLSFAPDASISQTLIDYSDSRDDFSSNLTYLRVGLAKRIKNKSVQLISAFTMNYFSNTKSSFWSSYKRLDFGLIYNFQENIKDSYYIIGTVGYISNEFKSSDNLSSTIFNIGGGKRFQLSYFGLDSVSFSPNFSISKANYDDFESTIISIIPIAFNFFI